MRTLLITPPMVDLNAPYPATGILYHWLKKYNHEATQVDASIALFHKIFCQEGLARIISALAPGSQSSAVENLLQAQVRYLNCIDPIVDYLRGLKPDLPNLDEKLCSRQWAPEGPTFLGLNEKLSFFIQSRTGGSLGRYIATCVLKDITLAIQEGIDTRFSLTSFGERLVLGKMPFASLKQALEASPTLIDTFIDEYSQNIIQRHHPDVIGITLPFAGCVLGAFRIARFVKKHHPCIKVIVGGGFVNTALRTVNDPMVFEYVDAISLGEGVGPLLSCLEHWNGTRDNPERVFVKKRSSVCFYPGNTSTKDVAESNERFLHAGILAPIEGLDLSNYISLAGVLSQFNRLSQEGPWFKAMLAEGCYWGKCAFCDISLDHVAHYRTSDITVLVKQLEKSIEHYGLRRLHLVDLAAPPELLKQFSNQLIDRNLKLEWRGNIRLDRKFTPDLADLMHRAGCVAVTAGFEALSNRLLKKIKKGVSVKQAIEVATNISQSGILIHGYLMYGLPGETFDDVLESLNHIRQLFAQGILNSVYWHRFEPTLYSPIGMNPQEFGIVLIEQNGDDFNFSNYRAGFADKNRASQPTVDQIGAGLRYATHSYMMGLGLEINVRSWFEHDD